MSDEKKLEKREPPSKVREGWKPDPSTDKKEIGGGFKPEDPIRKGGYRPTAEAEDSSDPQKPPGKIEEQGATESTSASSAGGT